MTDIISHYYDDIRLVSDGCEKTEYSNDQKDEERSSCCSIPRGSISLCERHHHPFNDRFGFILGGIGQA